MLIPRREDHPTSGGGTGPIREDRVLPQCVSAYLLDDLRAGLQLMLPSVTTAAL